MRWHVSRRTLSPRSSRCSPTDLLRRLRRRHYSTHPSLSHYTRVALTLSSSCDSNVATRLQREELMKQLRALAVAVAIFVLTPLQPAHAQISPNAVWSCEFTNSPTDCGLYLEAAASTRATLVGPGRDGPTAVQLTTQPGDINIAGSGSNERADLVLARSSTYCNQGQDEWWAHSLMFPPGYVPPPVASVWNWGALFDFHNSSPGGGQPNFMVYATPTGLELHMAGGPNTVNRPSDPGYYSIAIGPITKNVWYDFVYHVKWSSGSDGLFQAWLNGKQVMNYSGPNLYVSQSCYLKIANYHTALGVPVSVVHSRVVMAHTQADVQIGSGGTPPPTVPVPNVVGQTQAAATSAITSAGLTAGTVTMQSSTTVASGNVISESPAAGTSVARVDAAASKYKPQSVGELVNSHDHTALGEIWAWAGCGDANTQIATAPAIARNKFMEPPVMKKMGLCYRSFCYWSFCYWSCTRNSNESRDCRAGLSLERRRLEGGLRQ
ncbi:MAG: PASTA domain-containing protein, partial [Gammaproteobacteria bacterium]